MPLTETQRLQAERAKLESLISDLTAAMRAKQNREVDANERIRAAAQALIVFQTETEFPRELNPIARATVLTATGQVADHAIDEIATIIAGLTPSGEAFRTAREIAKSGERGLILPKVAAVAKQTLQIFTELRGAIDKLREAAVAAGEADDLGALATAIAELLPTIETLPARVKELTQ